MSFLTIKSTFCLNPQVLENPDKYKFSHNKTIPLDQFEVPILDLINDIETDGYLDTFLSCILVPLETDNFTLFESNLSDDSVV